MKSLVRQQHIINCIVLALQVCNAKIGDYEYTATTTDCKLIRLVNVDDIRDTRLVSVNKLRCLISH